MGEIEIWNTAEKVKQEAYICLLGTDIYLEELNLHVYWKALAEKFCLINLQSNN